MRVNVVCVSVGPKYPMAYVETLLDMVLRNASTTPHELACWCLTDRPGELPEGVAPIPAPEGLPGWWAKLALFSPDMPWAPGERVVYFDLDVAITGRLEDLVETKGIARDYGWPTYNSSVMVWDHGEHRDAWDRFSPEIMTRAPGPLVPAEALPAGTPNGGDQEFLTEIGGWDLLPAEWCVSYKWQALAWPPSGSKVVIFHGDPKPTEIAKGWVPNVWKVGGFTSLPEMNGVNVTHDHLKANIEANVTRDVPWFTGFKDNKRRAVIVGGAPSLLDHIADIKAHKRAGASIITVNNAWRVLVEHGITPDNHVMLDARAENAAFLEGSPAGTRYLVASQCHPAVFDALEGRDVVMWHNGFGDNEILRQALDPYWDEGPNQRPCVIVPGGGTVCLRALWLATFAGFKAIHCYGMDSSYHGDQHHAYAQTMNDADAIMEVVMLDDRTGEERRYRAARWMVRQASEFRETYADLKARGVQVFVHGKGLLPDIARQLRQEARAA